MLTFSEPFSAFDEFAPAPSGTYLDDIRKLDSQPLDNVNQRRHHELCDDALSRIFPSPYVDFADLQPPDLSIEFWVSDF